MAGGPSGWWRHAGALGFFAALTIAWTWPLARHLSDAIPGDPGDNYSFLWNLWWMRHVRATPGLAFFRTTFLFYPFGTTIANHPHTALPAFIGATALNRLPLATAQNAILLTNVFANMASTYWLAWSVTRHRRAAILAAVTFGTSPYFAGHLLGHFDLLAGWALPVFALLFHAAMSRQSTTGAIATGFVLAATAYTAYYYVVYVALFAVTYVIASARVQISSSRRVLSHRLRLARGSLIIVAAAAAAVALAIAVSGGTTLRLAGRELSLHRPQNPLSLMWLAAIGAALCTWRPTVVVDRRALPIRRAAIAAGWIVAVFAIVCAPIIVETARLVRQGEYVTPVYFWRSAPRGVDLLGPLAGHPRHPLMRTLSQHAYTVMHIDYIETVAWIGIVPALLLCIRRSSANAAGARVWWIVAGVFALWAAGPFLTVGGLDTGLWLPGSLARYIPFVANARVPGRAMVGVYLALAMVIASGISGARGSLRSPALQWLLILAVAFEYFDAPVPLTRLDDPQPYRALNGAPPGAVCEVPFGLGDGLGPGAGSQDRRVLFYATIHAHPLAGGYIGRMPAGAERRYESLPVTSTLLALSRREDEGARAESNAPVTAGRATDGPCTYFVVNRAAASANLQAYVKSLPVRLLSSDGIRDVYRLEPRPDSP